MEQCASLSGRDDCPVKVAPLLSMVGDWQTLLDGARAEYEIKELRKHARTGRPLGDEGFLDQLEELAGRLLKPKKAGRPKKERNR